MISVSGTKIAVKRPPSLGRFYADTGPEN